MYMQYQIINHIFETSEIFFPNSAQPAAWTVDARNRHRCQRVIQRALPPWWSSHPQSNIRGWGTWSHQKWRFDSWSKPTGWKVGGWRFFKQHIGRNPQVQLLHAYSFFVLKAPWAFVAENKVEIFDICMKWQLATDTSTTKPDIGHFQGPTRHLLNHETSTSFFAKEHISCWMGCIDAHQSIHSAHKSHR